MSCTARSRREFLRDASLAVALIPTVARANPAPNKAKLELPAVIATWDYGVTLCAVA